MIESFIAPLILLVVFTAPLIYLYRVVYLLRQYHWASEQARQHTICPACHRVVQLTFFMCPDCNQANELIPTEKEVFYQQCSCGKMLPKIPQHGRNELVALCPNHHPNYYPISKYAGTYPEVVIPIVGGTSTGKSAFLAAWTVYSQGQLQFQHGVGVTFPFKGSPEYAKDCIRRFQKGVPPIKTSIVNPCALGMDIVSRTNRKGLRLYLYDVAGEVFDPLGGASENALAPFEYYDFMDGVIFVIDPFSTPVIRQKYSQSLSNFGTSDKPTDDTCEKFIRGLYEHNLARNEYHFASCAVVITKADAKDDKYNLDLDSLIGEVAAKTKMRTEPDLSFEDALHEVCAMQLQNWGMGRVLDLLEGHFKEVRCFSVSAFGHSPQTDIPFASRRVELPILWLLKKQRQTIFTSR